MNLRVWHERLNEHFRRLHQERSGNGWPVFALEHGLSQDELQNLRSAVREFRKQSPPSDQNWLPWIVYAAEIGYRFEGFRYWPIFEEETPGWDGDDRYWLRHKYSDFHRGYGGAKPSGPWAESFTLISWPITHALLPTYLQRQLINVLHGMESEALVLSPETLGEQVAARGSGSSDRRFLEFIQNKSLTGQIAAALLAPDEPGGQAAKNTILPSTLKRISGDLDQRTREELEKTRERALSTRLRLIRQVGHGQGATGAGGRAELAAHKVEARLILRPQEAGPWEIVFETPDFSPLYTLLPSLLTFLNNTRCILASSGRFRPPRWLSHGVQQIPLSKWPGPGEQVIRFERTLPEGEAFSEQLKTIFQVGAAAKRLFKVALDGLAYEIKSGLVRPRNRYVLVSSDALRGRAPYSAATNVCCAGVHALALTVPEFMTEECQSHIRELGLRPARQIDLWPAGLPAAAWDGEGQGEWVGGVGPCLAARTSHTVDSIKIELTGVPGETLELKPEAVGRPIFVQLPQLPVGLYRLEVSERATPEGDYEGVGGLDILVREPRPWAPGVSQQGALLFLVDPTTPTLEQLWDGQVGVDIIAPEGRRVSCEITLRNRAADKLLLSKQLPALTPPVSSAAWRSYIADQLRKADVLRCLEDADTCELRFNAEELGRFELKCEREFKPLRWVVEKLADGHRLTLTDEADAQEHPEIKFYAFTEPDRPTVLQADVDARAITAPRAGGLFVARAGSLSCAVVVPQGGQQTIRTPEDLRGIVFETKFTRRDATVQNIKSALELFDLWSESRTTGDLLAEWARHKVLRDHLIEIFGMFGGRNWRDAELSFQKNPAAQGSLTKLGGALLDGSQGIHRTRTVVREEQIFADLIIQEYGKVKDEEPEAHARRLASLAEELLRGRPLSRQVHGQRVRAVSKPAYWQAEFALRLASAPGGVVTFADNWFDDGLRRLLEIPVLARAARYIVLAVDQHFAANGSKPYTSLYRGWEWQ